VPHIIIEYAESAVDKTQVAFMLQAIHHSVSDSGLFESSHIKTRANPFTQFTHAGGDDPYIHVQARIKSGRNAENKQRLGSEILAGLSTLNIPVTVITVEIIDMDRDSYSKWTQK